eukprot:720379-Rhodomonas_salina.8
MGGRIERGSGLLDRWCVRSLGLVRSMAIGGCAGRARGESGGGRAAHACGEWVVAHDRNHRKCGRCAVSVFSRSDVRSGEVVCVPSDTQTIDGNPALSPPRLVDARRTASSHTLNPYAPALNP